MLTQNRVKDTLIGEVENGGSYIHWLIYNKQHRDVELEIQSQPNLLKTTSSFDWLPLHIAAMTKHPILLKMLLSHHIPINAKDTFGNTALHYATLFEIEDNVNLLLRYSGIDINNKNNNGQTAYHIAALNGSDSLCDTLSMFGALDTPDLFLGKPSDYSLLRAPQDPIPFNVTDQETSLIQAENLFHIVDSFLFPYFSCQKNYIAMLLNRQINDYKTIINKEKNKVLRDRFATIPDPGIHNKLSIKWINDHKGFGLIAVDSFSAGEFIGIYSGHIRKLTDILLDEHYDKEGNPYIMILEENTEIDSPDMLQKYAQQFFVDGKKKGGYTKFINHSHSPNCEVVLMWDRGIQIPLIKVKDNQCVNKGTEITFDYGNHYGASITRKHNHASTN